MIFEFFIVFGFTICGIFFSRKKYKEKIFLQSCLVENRNEKENFIPFFSDYYEKIEDFEHIEEIFFEIALDPEKNKFFRDNGIIAFSILEEKSGLEFFRVHLKK